MGVDRGVRQALSKVSNITWFRLIPARSVAPRTERANSVPEVPTGAAVVALTVPTLSVAPDPQ